MVERFVELPVRLRSLRINFMNKIKYIYFEKHSANGSTTMKNENVLLIKPRTNSDGWWGFRHVTKRHDNTFLVVDQAWVDLEKYELDKYPARASDDNDVRKCLIMFEKRIKSDNQKAYYAANKEIYARAREKWKTNDPEGFAKATKKAAQKYVRKKRRKPDWIPPANDEERKERARESGKNYYSNNREQILQKIRNKKIENDKQKG